MPAMPQGRILVTWMCDNFRMSGLVQPVLKELESEEPLVICGNSDMRCKAPVPARAIFWTQAMHFDVAAWRSDYRKCRGPWQERLRGLCRKHGLPRGIYDRLAFHLLVSSQSVAGCLEFLQTVRPSAILTEYDRNSMWSSLVLSARFLGIPTFTMIHGVLNERAFGYVPVLADKVFCWGELQRRMFLTEGEDPAKLLLGGCPRLTRDLAVTQADGRKSLGLEIDKPAVMLATGPCEPRFCLEFAECFCLAARRSETYSAFVRLHPSEKLESYAELIRRYPNVRFTSNADATLDEALAASDIVVVHSSGLGSDALVKGRLTVVLDLPTQRLGHGLELIERAGCPRATSSESLHEIVLRLLGDSPERRACEKAREAFVAEFIAYFGESAAKEIAQAVRQAISARM
jgi:hypothetical protein